MEKDKYLEQLNKAIKSAIETEKFNPNNVINKSKNVCIFGLGRFFEEAFLQQSVKENYNVNLLCDNSLEKLDKIEKDPKFNDLKVITVDELAKIDNLSVILMLGNPWSVIDQLKKLGIKNIFHYNELSVARIMNTPKDVKWFEKSVPMIIETYKMLGDNESKKVYVNILCNRIAPEIAEYSYDEMYMDKQYFNNELIEFNDNESFVDCGAYNGDTVEEFLNRVNNKFENIYAFELDDENYKNLNLNISKFSNQIKEKIHFFNMGVWCEEKEIDYGRCSENDPAGGISIYKSQNSKKAKVVSLDQILMNKKITIIKMDVEGSEYEALIGAQKIIKEQKPKLEICLYHKISDFWIIPMYLKKLVPEYKFKIRHHSKNDFLETVCYAYV